MPLLLCPNCQAGMKRVEREGVHIDVCPECRGVWLDRGELEAILEGERREAAPWRPQAASPRERSGERPAWERERDNDWEDRDDYRRDRPGQPHRKRGLLGRLLDAID
ncbi:MAG TPA: zf-TFIIB domain-containing protein [Deinococcales bacterium]|nr:zf-TFIIB domain-containing protein [Deinococcales bacterium]